MHHIYPYESIFTYRIFSLDNWLKLSLSGQKGETIFLLYSIQISNKIHTLCFQQRKKLTQNTYNEYKFDIQKKSERNLIQLQ